MLGWREDSTPEEHAARRRLVGLLTEEYRWSVRLWEQASSQVRLLNPMAESKHATYVLDLVAVDRIMDWESVPQRMRREVFAGLELLLDTNYHSGRRHPWLCYHHLVAVDPNCFKCARRWKCPSCKRPLVIHLHDCAPKRA